MIYAAPPPTPVHHCAADAVKHGRTLLNLQFAGEPGIDEPIVSIGKEVKVLPPVKSLKGTDKFDVLEVWGYIYKAEYRMRFLYIQMPDTCALVGQEIIEKVDP